jgi:hypothetical protein
MGMIRMVQPLRFSLPAPSRIVTGTEGWKDSSQLLVFSFEPSVHDPQLFVDLSQFPELRKCRYGARHNAINGPLFAS